MEINLYRPQDLLAVDGYGPWGFSISGQRFETAVMLHQSGCQAWSPEPDLPLDSFRSAAAFLQHCEVVLLGSGSRSVFFPPSQRAALKELGLRVEVMDTGAACRTYNALLGDGRKVGALLMPPV